MSVTSFTQSNHKVDAIRGAVMHSAEELFRFAALRAPVDMSVDVLELPEDAAVVDWIKEKIASDDWGKALTDLQSTFRKLFGSPIGDTFRLLLAMARSNAEVLSKEALDGPFVEGKKQLVEDLYGTGWKLFVQGIRFDHPSELDELRQLLVLTNLRLRWYSGKVTLLPADEVKRLLQARIRLPRPLTESFRKRWSEFRANAASIELEAIKQQHSDVEENIKAVNRLQRVVAALETETKRWRPASTNVGMADTLNGSLAEAHVQASKPEDSIEDASTKLHEKKEVIFVGVPASPSYWKDSEVLQSIPELEEMAAANISTAKAADVIARNIAERIADLARSPYLRATDLPSFDDVSIQQTLKRVLNSRPASSTDGDVHRYGMRPIGVADLRVVKQVLVRYEAGELAHIENVLMGEERLRRHTRIEKEEQSRFSLSETEVENSKDVQSTNRFEVSREAKSLLNEQQKNAHGVKVSGHYGTVKFEASSDISSQRTAEQSLAEESKSSREVTERAVERVRNRVVEQRSVKSSIEVREVAEHKQKAEGGNVIGKYRWVDKIYRAQIHNYGARAMYEFMVPRPAAMLHYLLAKEEEPGGIVGPAPKKPDIRPVDIKLANWLSLSDIYGVALTPPPPSEVIESVEVSGKAGEKLVFTGQFNKFSDSSKGYIPGFVECEAAHSHTANDDWLLDVAVGQSKFDVKVSPVPPIYIKDGASPISYYVFGSGSILQFAVLLRMHWERTPLAEEIWRLDCFNKIMDRYAEQLKAHNEKLSAAAVGGAQTMSAMTDSQMRTIERNELKRSIVDIARFMRAGNGAVMSSIYARPPLIDRASLDEVAAEVRFFEGAFEWDQMVYVFHPYFWSGDAKTWGGALFDMKGDETFSAFLNAGFATAVLPVRSGFEHSVAVYWETGEISRARVAPSDDTLLRMSAEVTQRSDLADDGFVEGEPWQYRVPTSLVILWDGDSKEHLPDFSNQLPMPVTSFVPSASQCGGKSYNSVDWPSATGPEVATELRHLGYPIPYDQGPTPFESAKVKSLITAFQRFCNSEGISSKVVGKDLDAHGQTDPCTLMVLSHCRRLRRLGDWTGPAKAPS